MQRYSGGSQCAFCLKGAIAASIEPPHQTAQAVTPTSACLCTSRRVSNPRLRRPALYLVACEIDFQWALPSGFVQAGIAGCRLNLQTRTLTFKIG